jgi:hypothetical protein
LSEAIDMVSARDSKGAGGKPRGRAPRREGIEATAATAPENKDQLLTQTAGQWPKPIPLGEVVESQPFPENVLPAALQRLVEETAWAMNCPQDFVAVPLLTMAGGAIANSRHLAITRTHTQSPCLFAAIVGRPGSSKSNPIKLLRKPFDVAQERLFDDFDRKFVAWEEAEGNDRGKKPVPQRCVVQDITTESLGAILHENPRGVLKIHDELMGLVAGLNQYKAGGRGNDRQFYLDLWAGSPIITDRKSDKAREGRPLYIPHPFAAIIGTLQPDMVERLRGERSHGQPPPDDGFLDRFLIVYPAELPAVGEEWRDVSEGLLAKWHEAIDALLKLPMIEENRGSWHRPKFVHLTKTGRQQWENFTRSLASEMNGEDFPHHLRGVWSKLKGYGGRLALVLHFLRWAVQEVDEEDVDGKSMEGAARLVDYFKSHAKKICAVMFADQRMADARRIVRWITTH